MNFVMTGSGKMIEIQATAEQVPFDDDQLQKMLALAKQGVGDLVQMQQSVLGTSQFVK
jgi:ribonuclease PH